MKWWGQAAALALAAVLLSGCGEEKERAGTRIFFEGSDEAGQTVRLDKRPDKVAVLAPSLIGILDAMGADYGAYANSPGREDPPSAQGKILLGPLYHLNVETLVGWKPDVAVGFVGVHDGMADILETNHIPLLRVSLMDYGHLKESISLLGKALGKEEESRRLLENMDAGMKSAEALLPEGKRPTCVIIQGTGRGLTVEVKETIAADAAHRLGVKNVFYDENAVSSHIPFSMENLVTADPDVIFLTSMVQPGKEKETLDAWVSDQPAWQSLRAVKAGRIYVLPQTLFLSPGIQYPEAVKYMAQILEKDEATYGGQ